MPRSVARRCSETDSRPSAEASLAAWLRMACRVFAPLSRRPSVSSSAIVATQIKIHDRSCYYLDNKPTDRAISSEVGAMVVIQEAFAGHAALGRLEAGDGERLARFFYRLSPETVYRRFLSPIARPEQLERQRLLDVDG